MNFETTISLIQSNQLDPAEVQVLHSDTEVSIKPAQIAEFVNLEVLSNYCLEISTLDEVNMITNLTKLRYVIVLYQHVKTSYKNEDLEKQSINVGDSNIPDTIISTFIRNRSGPIDKLAILLYDPKTLYDYAIVAYDNDVVWVSGGMTFLPQSIISLTKLVNTKNVFVPRYEETSSLVPLTTSTNSGQPMGVLQPNPVINWLSQFDINILTYNLGVDFTMPVLIINNGQVSITIRGLLTDEIKPIFFPTPSQVLLLKSPQTSIQLNRLEKSITS